MKAAEQVAIMDMREYTRDIEARAEVIASAPVRPRQRPVEGRRRLLHSWLGLTVAIGALVAPSGLQRAESRANTGETTARLVACDAEATSTAECATLLELCPDRPRET